MDLNSFLTFGYFLDKDNPDLKDKFQFDIDKEKYEKVELPELVKIGKTKLLTSFEKIFPKNESHVIPLSGGLDSRAILACLLEFTQAKNIHTYTFGTPHTYDYDIGNYIAKKAGTSHLRIPLNKHTYTHDEMIEASMQNEQSTHLFHHPPVLLIDKYFDGCYTWSGFMGGSLPGSGLNQKPSTTMNDALSWFKKKNTYVSSVKFNDDKNKVFAKHIDLPDFESCQLTLDEQINFFNRQKKYTYYHVKLCGKKMLHPFIEKSWANFALSIDNKYRYEKEFYERLLYESFPSLFKFKTKSNSGLPLYPSFFDKLKKRVKSNVKKQTRTYFSKRSYALNPWTNYLPFGEHIRNSENFDRLIYESLSDLIERGVLDDIQIKELYKNHKKGISNHSDALLVLTSLEYHFKSGLNLEQVDY